MASETAFVDWTDLRVQAHWYKLRHEFEGELRSATSDIRKQFEVNVKLNTATIVSDGDRSVLRIPVSASYRTDLEQTIAAILVTSTEDDEPRIAAIAGGIAENKIIRVVGLGPAAPLDGSDPSNPINRRISIIVLNQRAEHRILADGEVGTGEAPR